MTYKCKHCGRPITGPSPQGTWFHLEYSEKCYNQHGPPEPDGLMPAPPNPAQELCNRWQEKREAYLHQIEALTTERDALKAANAELSQALSNLHDICTHCDESECYVGSASFCAVEAALAKHRQ